MVDLSLTESQRLLRQSVRETLEEGYPLDVVRGMDESETGFSEELWHDMADLGWMALGIPAEWEGQGGDLIDLALVYEEMGRACLPLPHFVSAALCGLAILEAGSPEQKRQFLPAIGRGEHRWSFAFSGREYGWGTENVQTQAVPTPDGFALQGVSFFVPYGSTAHYLLVPARTSNGTDGNGITLFAVDAGGAGITVRGLAGSLGERVAQVTLEDTPVDASMVIGDVDQAWEPLTKALDKATAVLCASMAGGCQRVFEMASDYGRNRMQFGVPIGSFQRVQDRILEIVNAADAARWATYEALWALDSGRPDAWRYVSLAKVVASTGYMRGTEEAHHVFAGYGTDRNLGLWQFTTKARTLYHYLGDPEHHRARIAMALAL